MANYHEDLQIDRLYLTNQAGLSESDLEIVLNYLHTKSIINLVELQKYRNNRTSLLSRVTAFLDNLDRKGPDAISQFYRAFEEANNRAFHQLPSKSSCDVDGPTPGATKWYPESEGSEIYCKKLKQDMPELTNGARLSDIVLQQLVQYLAIEKVFNEAEKEKIWSHCSYAEKDGEQGAVCDPQPRVCSLG
ncbi:uncharacterized protein LOC103172130 isoform X2 [Callorhinchus milii]|uniref:uncharacterized protein LOC103172130 isoform X2 n=1 Tax=Callorhinchus milii TaxID=7868 RepID=UPI001C3F8CCB|nr:uncharacterized protein LOC103172130 isoform X2 [Callorhinchus milii]